MGDLTTSIQVFVELFKTFFNFTFARLNFHFFLPLSKLFWIVLFDKKLNLSMYYNL